MSISFEICMINPPFTFEICRGQFSTIVSGITGILLLCQHIESIILFSFLGKVVLQNLLVQPHHAVITVSYGIFSSENSYPRTVTIMHSCMVWYFQFRKCLSAYVDHHEMLSDE
jgi:hypothetical protein